MLYPQFLQRFLFLKAVATDYLTFAPLYVCITIRK
jgi:hypothetical protein